MGLFHRHSNRRPALNLVGQSEFLYLHDEQSIVPGSPEHHKVTFSIYCTHERLRSARSCAVGEQLAPEFGLRAPRIWHFCSKGSPRIMQTTSSLPRARPARQSRETTRDRYGSLSRNGVEHKLGGRERPVNCQRGESYRQMQEC